MKYSICRQQKEKCPFRVFDVQLDVFICSFYKEYTSMVNDGNSFGAKPLLNKACEEYKNEEKRLEFISKGAEKETVKILRCLEVGDTLFWFSRSKDVTCIQKPTEISQIARIKCQGSDGKIIKIPAYLLRSISKGNFSGEYFIDGAEKVKGFKYKVNYYGFRTEIEKRDNGFLLKIYGDSQQEVDDFIISLEQDFDISPYI